MVTAREIITSIRPLSGSASGVSSVPPPTLAPLPIATIITGRSRSLTTLPSTSTRSRWLGGFEGGEQRADGVAELAEVDLADADAAQPLLPLVTRRLAWAPAPTCTLLTTISPVSSTIRSTGRGSPSSTSRAASSMSSGMSVPRAKSLPVPSGSRASVLPVSSLRRCSAATTACRLPSPPATTIRREPARWRTPSSSPGLDVAATSTDAVRRRIDRASVEGLRVGGACA